MIRCDQIKVQLFNLIVFHRSYVITLITLLFYQYDLVTYFGLNYYIFWPYIFIKENMVVCNFISGQKKKPPESRACKIPGGLCIFVGKTL